MNLHTLSRSRRYAVGDFSSIVHPDPYVVQSASYAIQDSSAMVAAPSIVTAGNLLVVAYGYYNAGATPTVTDNEGNTFQKGCLVTAIQGTYIGFWARRATSTGTYGVTASVAGGSYNNIGFIEFGNAYGGFTGISGSAAAAGGTPTVSITSNGIILAAMEAYHSNTVITGVAPFSFVCFANGADAIGVEWYYNRTNSTVSPAFGGSGVDNFLVVATSIA